MKDIAHLINSIRVPIETISVEKHIQKLVAEIGELQQTLESKDAQIEALANTMAFFKELVQKLRDEIAILKRVNPKPKIKPSDLEGSQKKISWHKRFQRYSEKEKSIELNFWVKNLFWKKRSLLKYCFRVISDMTVGFQSREFKISYLARSVIKMVKRVGKRGQPKGKPRKKKKGKLKINEKQIIPPKSIPKGAVFKGYRSYTVQDIVFKPYNTQYLMAQYMLPDGSYIRGELPKEIQGHYGPELVAHILHQYHVCRVTEPLLLEQLIARGILISAGQLNNILINNNATFCEEVDELLSAGVEADEQIQVDDTGGRHGGSNQYTTVIGNKWFSLFTTTERKNRINFLKLLQQGKHEYLINEDTLEYLREVAAPSYLPGYIAFSTGEIFTTLAGWEQFLEKRNITRSSEINFVTEAALYASIIEHGIPRNLGVHSDDAGQFNVFVRSLCWVHEERHYRKLVMTTDEARDDLKRVQDQIWAIYQKLKDFKSSPDPQFAEDIEKEFDSIFQQKTCSSALNHQLKKTYKKKQKLLRVLQRPETPLHNNSSETDARAAKTKLKVSGGTRSDLGKIARDTFLSIKQTCRKLGVNFIAYLNDRVRGLYMIPKLADLIRQRSQIKKTAPPI